MVDSFVLFADYADTIRDMSDTAAGILFKMIFNHVTGADLMDGVEVIESGDLSTARVAYGFISRQIDRSVESYEETRAKRREAGARGAEKRWRGHSKGIANDGNAMAKDSKGMASDDKGCLPNPIPNPIPIDKKIERFKPPTLEEVKAYCEERKSPVDPVRFFEYFQTGGWKDSKGNRVRNWKQKIITWEKHAGDGKKKNAFTDIQQNEYDFDQLERELLAN